MFIRCLGSIALLSAGLAACSGSTDGDTGNGGGGVGGGAGSGGADPACMQNGEAICAGACDCDASAGCSVRYPGGSSQQFGTEAQCASAWAGYCAELDDGVLDQTACAADLDGAACVDVGDRQALDVPESCFTHFPHPSPECTRYADEACTAACACAPGTCYVSVDGAGWVGYTTYDGCYVDLQAACELDQVGVSDFEACSADVAAAGCTTLGSDTGLVLPPSCR
jgi:hypothetical protein